DAGLDRGRGVLRYQALAAANGAKGQAAEEDPRIAGRIRLALVHEPELDALVAQPGQRLGRPGDEDVGEQWLTPALRHAFHLAPELGLRIRGHDCRGEPYVSRVGQ